MQLTKSFLIAWLVATSALGETKVRNSITQGAPVNAIDKGAKGDGIVDDALGINASIKSAPDGTGVIVYATNLTAPILASDIFAGIGTRHGTLVFGPGTYSQSATQNVPSGWDVRCAYAGAPNGASFPTKGTIFKWTGATSSTMWLVRNATPVRLDGCAWDGNNTASLKGVWLDSTNGTPTPTRQTVMTNWYAQRFLNGGTVLEIGNPTGDMQVDALTINHFNLYNADTGIHTNSQNAVSYGTISDCFMFDMNVGMYFERVGNPLVRACAFGGFHGSTADCAATTGLNCPAGIRLTNLSDVSRFDTIQAELTGGAAASALLLDFTGTVGHASWPIKIENSDIDLPVRLWAGNANQTVVSYGNKYAANMNVYANDSYVLSIGDRVVSGGIVTSGVNDLVFKLAADVTTFGSRTFSILGTPANFTVVGCSDCTIANPCAGGGTGALAKRLNGVWVCN